MNATIEHYQHDIAERREEIKRYEAEIIKVESAIYYDHPYWQGLTDELRWEKAALARDLDQLEKLQLEC